MMFDFCRFLAGDEIFLLGELLVEADMGVCCVRVLWECCISMIGFCFYFRSKGWGSNFYVLL